MNDVSERIKWKSYTYICFRVNISFSHRHCDEYAALSLWPLVASCQWYFGPAGTVGWDTRYRLRRLVLPARTLAWASARAKWSEAPRCWRITLTDIWGFQRRDRICVPTVCICDRKRERIASKCASPSFHFFPPFSLNRWTQMIYMGEILNFTREYIIYV